MTQQIGNIFISYSRKDEDIARALKDRLSDVGIACYMDTARIMAGDNWRNKTADALDSCTLLVVVCTSNSIASHEVTAEWAYAAGRGITVIPVLYQAGLLLPAGLDALDRLDFIDPLRRQWDRLISRIVQAQVENLATGGLIRRAGVESILFGRNELIQRLSVPQILARVVDFSELTVVGRSLESWSREFREVQNACDRRNIRARFALVDPALRREKWMIPSDYAQVDLKPSIDKLRRMPPLSADSRGSLELYLLPNSTLLSFTGFEDISSRCGILEMGANLHFDERISLILRPGYQGTPDLLGSMSTTFDEMLRERTPIFTLGCKE
ncbi:toll/interleukin-1 receptor domain-containing protein [Streptomyces sp. VNUA74]|uniref:toll/interleukin-1 receptor domain-containing protein n=1 Tax=Streptomyces TaxID=1883 RepID=UPI00280A63A2|nr:toll/interleukin-1 receptor domain-containing protein [Streptomyces sp. VNUA74]WML80916.1 toll/interleukin-1 receptor domain-containing protein [Streptomyces sp. VNUA74]